MWKICLIVNSLTVGVLWWFDCSNILIISVLAGLLVAECMARLTFHLFFSCREDYEEAWHYHFKWDIFSLIDGELWDDWVASFKLSVYHTLILLFGVCTFALVHYLLKKWL